MIENDTTLVRELVELRKSVDDFHVALSEMRRDLAQNYLKNTDKAQVYGALAKAQGMYKPLVLSGEVAGKKCATLGSILNATREALSANELVFIQEIHLMDDGKGGALLKTKVGHSSGQEIESVARVVHFKLDRQTGNSYENQKRLHAATLLGIALGADDPVYFDDGGIEQADLVTLEELKKPHVERNLNREEVVSNDEYKSLLFELDGYPDIVKNIQNVYGIETLADLPKSEYYKARDKIRTIIETLKDYQRSKRATL